MMWSLGVSSKIRRAAAFCTRCSGPNVASGTPAKSELQYSSLDITTAKTSHRIVDLTSVPIAYSLRVDVSVAVV